jgi:hypothetical protein
MSIVYPRIRSCSLVALFSLFVLLGEVSLLYFSLKYFIVYNSKYQSAWILIFIIINNAFLFGLKLFTFISQGLPPNNSITNIFIFFNVVLCTVFCVVESFFQFDLLAIVIGIILQFVSTLYHFDHRKISSLTTVSIVYEV